jgi:murein DD-endopeptidase MepM/ murein hydrolase activator NlpD
VASPAAGISSLIIISFVVERDPPHGDATHGGATQGATPVAAAPTPSAQETQAATPTAGAGINWPATTPAPPAEASAAAPGALLVPVQGVRPEDLSDTYTQSRSEGRTHNAIDIMAPRGTPVVAAADGRIVKLFNSVPGGITLYQLAEDNKTILYYAHLERYADGISEGRFARRGDLIGYVGDTGNAGPGNYHLHFSVSIADDPKKWWDGANVNPYPLLTARK